MVDSKQIIAEIDYYLDNKISVIPVRDKEQEYNNRIYPVKSAYPWAKYQKTIITKSEIIYQMFDKYDTNGYALVCGEVSGNLEVIDIDVKNWLGIDSKLFTDLKTLFPDIFNKLRIHKTPSHGYHIIYRIADHKPGGNVKLAYKDGAKEAAIETRGENGYICASTSMGYKVAKNNDIPLITWAERCSIISICEGYNEKKKVAQIKKTNHINTYYDEDPFNHFNNSDAGRNVLIDFGWSFLGENNNFIWYTRPGKESGISASFNKEKSVFYIFTSSTQFENDRGYNPSTALGLLKFNGDNKQLYSWLINNGYGKVKKEKEIAKIEKSKKSKTLTKLPSNFSNESKLIFEKLKIEQNKNYPYGDFFYTDEEDSSKVMIDQLILMGVLHQMGYRNYEDELCFVKDNFVEFCSFRKMYDQLIDYISKEEDSIYFNLLFSYLETHNRWICKSVKVIDDDMFLNDTKNTCFKFYKNGILVIESNNINLHKYDEIDKYIWIDKIQNRDFNFYEGGVYIDFLEKSIGIDDSLKCSIGFLCHEYKDETTANIIVLSEQCENPQDGGGSGKNVFCNLLKYSTTYTSKPGVQTKFDEKFFQSWNRQKVFGISDVPKNFDFAFLKEPASGSFIWKKLFKDEVEVPVHKAPKFIVQTNYSYEIVDGGLKRRIVPIEFTNFFTIAGGLDNHYSKHFPNDWDEIDWNGYDTFIAKSIQLWVKNGLKIPKKELSDGGWIKQFEQTFGPVIKELIEVNWQIWVESVEVTTEEMKKNIDEYYNENGIPLLYRPSIKKINTALKYYGEKNKIDVKTNSPKRINGISYKCSLFLPFDIPF
jgi:hypothetical protein